MAHAWRLLADDGELSVVIPSDCRQRMEAEAALMGFSLVRRWAVKTTERKAPRRYLLAFRKHPAEIESGTGIIGSAWYDEIMKDFYL